MLAVTVCFTFAVAFADTDKDDILRQQQDLEKIRKEVDQGQKRLDSLRSVEKNVTHKITEYDQKISSDKKVINRLSGELRQLKQNISSASGELAERSDRLERSQRRYLGSIRQFYFAASRQDLELSISPNQELEKHRQVIYLRALAGYESDHIVQASNLLAQANDDLEELSGRRSEVNKLKKKRETSVAVQQSRRQKQQKDLDLVKRTSREEFDRVLTLQKAAEEMEALVARLIEEQSDASPGAPVPSSSAFTSLKGQLPSPFRGKIIAKFGGFTDPITNLKSFSPGITIKGKPGRSVLAVASGTVAYAGELRGYGNFVIINHDNQYYTTYAGLGEITVSKGQYVSSQEPLGKSASDGIVKFELRNRREPLDPVEWIRIESL
jgi:septal ring factor EnvC (AmiA/AmiB activator)